MSASAGLRAEVLRRFGAGPAEVEELLAYGESAFVAPAPEELRFPLPDEPFVEAWEEYAAGAEERGAAAVLRKRLVQLRFPVREGISATDAYQAATRRGVVPDTGVGEGWIPVDTGGVRLFLHPTPAGRLPVVVCRHRADFVSLVRSLARRNEPDAIPASMGACIVAGYNNWDRVARLRERFERGEPVVEGSTDWSETFRAVRERKELYQDRFVLLSSGPYSGVPAADLGLSEDEWLRLSLVIRLEHECAHYFTRRVFGSMRNSLLDELIADWVGITAAAGRFRADWFLRFMGLEEEGRYRAGGRLENYRGKPPLSDGAFEVLQSLVRNAARTLEAAGWGSDGAAPRADDRARSLAALAACTLEALAAGAGGPIRRPGFPAPTAA